MSNDLHDHDVEVYGEHLKGKRVAFIVTGSVAVMTAPKVIHALRKYSCEVYPYATEESLKFVTKDALEWASNHALVSGLSFKSEHLGQDGKSFDAVVVYGASYNFIGKMANGIADDAPSSLIASHINKAKIIYFPTMYGEMWNSPILQRNIALLDNLSNVTMVKPRFSTIKSEEFGEMVLHKANIPDERTCVCRIVRETSNSPLKGLKVLVTAGPTPVLIDNVRRITNRFSGKLGIEIANELYLRGADVFLLQSYTGIRPPSYIPCKLFQDYNEYKELCLKYSKEYTWGIFSAAVADYMPEKFTEGKIPSKGALKEIKLINTEKVIDLVLKESPNIRMISFKYEEGKKLSYLTDVATKRLNAGHFRLVGNDISLNKDGKQVCFLFELDRNGVAHVSDTAEGKPMIARMIANDMERNV